MSDYESPLDWPVDVGTDVVVEAVSVIAKNCEHDPTNHALCVAAQRIAELERDNQTILASLKKADREIEQLRDRVASLGGNAE